MQRHTNRTREAAFQLRSALASGLALWSLGCGGTSQHAPATPDDVQRTTAERKGEPGFRDLVVNAHAEALHLDCDHRAYESCNALDDDCNGVIDDECGYEGGAVQITVGWDTGADIDLYVTDPSGMTLYYNEKH